MEGDWAQNFLTTVVNNNQSNNYESIIDGQYTQLNQTKQNILDVYTPQTVILNQSANKKALVNKVFTEKHTDNFLITIARQEKREILNKSISKTKEKILIPHPNMLKFYPILSQPKTLTLYAFIMTRHPPTWHNFFISVEREIKHACGMIDAKSARSGKAIFPMINQVLTAFWLTPVFLMKAVIIGQDPYPGFTKAGMPKAMGACFCSERSYEMPESLKNVYKELEKSVEGWKHPGHPDIRCWGRQGVLLINTALTIEAGTKESHIGLWTPFTSKLMEYINENCKNIVFLLWGKKAQKVASSIYTMKHKKLEAYHPSPMSANSGYHFVGCNHFNLANEYLVEKGIKPIDWRIK